MILPAKQVVEFVLQQRLQRKAPNVKQLGLGVESVFAAQKCIKKYD